MDQETKRLYNEAIIEGLRFGIRICNGEGFCLLNEQIKTEGYKRTGIVIDIPTCEYKCIPIQCPNYIKCGEMIPGSFMNRGMCKKCNNDKSTNEGQKDVFP